MKDDRKKENVKKKINLDSEGTKVKEEIQQTMKKSNHNNGIEKTITESDEYR